MPVYKALNQQFFNLNQYSLVPIRMEDRYDIMRWRNDQIYHLRQNKPLTKEDQDRYFEEVVAKLFEKENPSQILFSFLEGENCIGYGGLVHINWFDKNAEISFIMATELEKDHFSTLWNCYLSLIEKVAFDDLQLHKVFLYAFDLRPHLYPAIELAGFKKEAVLKEHCLFEGRYLDVVIHAKWNREIFLRKASKDDLQITFDWAANSEVRRFALKTSLISFEEHSKWFIGKVLDPSCIYLIAEFNGRSVGSIRFDISGEGKALISYLLDPSYFGLGLGTKLLEEGIAFCRNDCRIKELIGMVMRQNKASIRVFEKLGFQVDSESADLLTYKLNIT
jgi:RimJ/RimL family protein N-acetyltransferase